MPQADPVVQRTPCWQSKAVRKWISFLQVHHLANDEPWWRENRDAGPVHEFRQAIDSFGNTVNASTDATLKSDLGGSIANIQHHLANLEPNAALWLRIVWHITIPVICGWTLWVAFELDEWAQFLSQLAVLIFTQILAAALVRNPRATNRINFKLWEDRLIGDLPTLIFYTVATRRAGLHQNYRLVIMMGVLTGILLLAVSLLPELWTWVLLIRSGRRAGRTHLSSDVCADLVRERDNLWSRTKALQMHIETADISGGFDDQFLLVKRGAHSLLAITDQYLPDGSRRDRPRYRLMPKAPAFVMTLILQAVTLYAASKQPWFLAYNAGWALWIVVRMGLNFRGAVAQKDVNRMFRSIVAGSATLLPLTLTLLIGGSDALDPLWVKLVLGGLEIILVICFSDIICTACDKFTLWITPAPPAERSADAATNC